MMGIWMIVYSGSVPLERSGPGRPPSVWGVAYVMALRPLFASSLRSWCCFRVFLKGRSMRRRNRYRLKLEREDLDAPLDHTEAPRR